MNVSTGFAPDLPDSAFIETGEDPKTAARCPRVGEGIHQAVVMNNEAHTFTYDLYSDPRDAMHKARMEVTFGDDIPLVETHSVNDSAPTRP